MKNILIPIDLSPASEMALQYVSKIFKEHSIIIFMLYAKGSGKIHSDRKIKQKYKKLVDKLLVNSNFEIEFIFADGELIEEINNATDELGISLVVMGTMGSLSENILSNSTKLVQSAHVPIVILPAGTNKTSISKIAYANDYKNIDKPSVFKILWDIARTFDAEVHILHINKNDEMADKEEEIIEYYLNHIEHEYIFITNPDIEEAIDTYIKEKEIDLLVVLPRKRADIKDAEDKSLVKDITQHAHVPVLTLG